MSVYAVLLFVVSGNVLDLIGYDYSSIAGSSVMKIHISTYFIIVTFGLFVVSYPDKINLARYYLSQKLGTLWFFCLANFAIINIIFDGRNGYGMYFDTHLHLFLCCLLLPFVSPRNMDRLEIFLHGFFAVNAVLAIIELAMGENVFPLMVYSPDGTMNVENRATAFLSHPLHAATLTCVYVVSLLTGGGSALGPKLRIPMIGLQIAALLAFGGRAALLLTLVIVTLLLLWHAVRFTAGNRMPRASLIAAATIIPVGMVSVAVLAQGGAFDQFLDRFTDDGGSARSRTLMLPLLLSFNWSELLWGASTDFARSQIYSYGLEWGVENPFIQMSVYQGVVVASMIMLGLALLLFESYRRLQPRAICAIGSFLLLCNTFGSYAGRFIAFAIFMIIVSTLFRRQDAPALYVT